MLGAACEEARPPSRRGQTSRSHYAGQSPSHRTGPGGLPEAAARAPSAEADPLPARPTSVRQPDEHSRRIRGPAEGRPHGSWHRERGGAPGSGARRREAAAPPLRAAGRASTRAPGICARPGRHVTRARASRRALAPSARPRRRTSRPPTPYAPPPTPHAPPLARSSPAWTTNAGSRLCQHLRGGGSLRAHPAPPRPEKGGGPYPEDPEGLCGGDDAPQTEANVNAGSTRWKLVTKRIYTPTA